VSGAEKLYRRALEASPDHVASMYQYAMMLDDKGVCMLQCVAVRCSALQCVAVCCSVLQCAAVCCSVLQCVAVC